jgi:rare lipoprotein A
LKIVLTIIIATLFVSCTSSPRFYFNKSQPTVKEKKRFFASEDTQIDTQIDTLRNLSNNIESITGLASFYADDFDGKLTANGEVYNMYELTAAHRTYPFNTMIRVVNLANDKTVIVRINDRGPFVDNRIIDLSLGAAIQLGMDKTGVQNVRLEIIEWGIN